MQAKEAHAAADESRSAGQSACEAVAANLQRVAQEQSDRLRQAQQSTAMHIAEEVQRLERSAAKQQSERAAAHADESMSCVMSCCLSLLHGCSQNCYSYVALDSAKAPGDSRHNAPAVCAHNKRRTTVTCLTCYPVHLTPRRWQQCSTACETNKQVLYPFIIFSSGHYYLVLDG